MISDPPTGNAALDGVYYVDYMSNLASPPGAAPIPDFSAYICTSPENLSADDSMPGVGNCSWEYTFSAVDSEDNPVISGDEFIAPWRSWWRLRCGTTVITCGPVTGIKVVLGEETITITGQTWEAYMARWQYPFDPRPDHVNDYIFPNTFIANELTGSGDPTPTGLCYQAQARDIAIIAGDLIEQAMNAIAYRMIFDVSAFGSAVGITTNYQYTLGDDSGMDSVLSDLLGVGEGFDWWITWDRKLVNGSPYRFGSQMSPTVVATITADMVGLVNFEFDNDGVRGNHILGQGSGFAAQTQLASAYGYALSQETFSRLDESFNYGDVRNQDQLNALTKKSLSTDINPARTLSITLDPNLIDDYWSTYRKGVALQVTVDTSYTMVNAAYQITKWELQATDDSQFVVVLTCDRIYASPADFGNPDL